MTQQILNCGTTSRRFEQQLRLTRLRPYLFDANFEVFELRKVERQRIVDLDFAFLHQHHESDVIGFVIEAMRKIESGFIGMRFSRS